MSKSNAVLSSSYESSKGRRMRQEEPAPVDTGLIRCVCPSIEDDGFTIQCERCLVWQHAYCVQITHETIPDHYLCDRCSKRKRPKLSKRIPISKKKLRKLDSEDDPSAVNNKKKKLVKSRIVSRYVYPIFKEAKERWSQSSRWKSHQETSGPLLYDHGPFVTMDPTTLLTKGVLIDAPVSNEGLFATRPIPSLRYLMEVTGDVLLKSEFKFDPANDFVILGTPLSHIMFYPTLDLCIDTRQFGNKARYIRRSCHPNAELRNVILSRDDKTIHLGLFARHLIEKGQEVTISWNWQRGHIAWKEHMNWHHQHKVKQGHDEEGHQVIDEEEERRRKATIKNMLDRFEKEFGSCACLNKRRCLIEQLRRQIAVPKEKSTPFKLPAVNILPAVKPGRRKSSIILLKPKPELESKAVDQVSNHNSRQLNVSPKFPATAIKNNKNGTEDSVDIDVTSNSPTLGNVKDASDDELLDVEGDIDIGDDLPASSDNVKDALPLLENNSSDDDDNADLSSLSSLSSLSVFEESGDDVTDDDEGRRNRTKSRKRKSSSRHSKSSRSHHNHHRPTSSSTASTPMAEKTSPVAPSILPRKKLWMRDYLNKHVADQVKAPGGEDRSIKTEVNSKSQNLEKTTDNYTENKSTTNEKPSSTTSNSAVDSEIKENNLMQMDEPTTAININPSSEETVVDAITTSEPKSPVKEGTNEVDTTMQERDLTEDTMDVDIPEADTNVFDIDDGELSDASTILLDEEELQNVYKRQPTEATTTAETEVVQHDVKLSSSMVQREVEEKSEEIIVTKDDTMTAEDVVIDDSDDSDPTSEIQVITSSSATIEENNAPEEVASEVKEALPEENIAVDLKDEVSTEEVNLEKKTIDDSEKKAVKKISLQEYILKQKSITP